ncbi:MAG: hypothetical protein KF734_19580 [Saprospiraceae bacterium]|nr:hypothetical protein [Saprospiraceae bacterium]
MTQAKLATLEEKLLHPDDWDQAINYFFDHFGTEPAFLELSKKTRLPIILTMMGEIGKKLFQKEAVALVNPMMFKVKEFNMIHGTCIIEERLITFVYLMNIHKGVFSIANLQTNKVEHCSRVSALPLTELNDEQEMYEEPWNSNPN